MADPQVDRITLPYVPRWYQKSFEDAMFGGAKRAYLLQHRRCGKDLACWNFTINCAVNDIPSVYYYILPTYSQGRKIIWDGLDEAGKRFLDYIPKELIDGKPNSAEMKIRFTNGSLIQVVGSDNYDSLRGTNPFGVVFSEHAMQTPRVWEEVISPILLKNGGWAVFNTTPAGKNHAFDLWSMAVDSKDWYTQLLTIDDTKLITTEQIDKERAEGKSEDIIQQEYFCSWDIGTRGAYYGKEMKSLLDRGRLTDVAVDDNHLVYTAWDLGYTDAMSIIFYQIRNNDILIVDHYENHGFALSHYLAVLRDRGYAYGKHFIPHDGANHNAITGETYVTAAKKLGFLFTVVPTNQSSPELGINRVRGLMPRFIIDGVKCEYLIKCLLQYHADYDDKAQVFRNRPKHDWSSHCFTGDTLVLTRHGTYPIMDLPKTGYVRTLKGWSKYENPRITRKDALIVEVRFQDGMTVKCTPDHLFLTESGWTCASSLIKGTKIRSCLTKSPNILMGGCIGYGHRRNIMPKAARRYIGMCGEMLLERFQKVAIYITKTVTLPIVGFGILSYCRPPNISAMRCKRGIKQVSLVSQAPKFWKRLLSGIDQTLVVCGISAKRSGARAGQNGLESRGNVYFAKKPLTVLLGRMGIHRNIVQTDANQPIIESVKELCVKEDVWCLTVPDEEQFSLANGAIVHNCADAMRVMAFAMDKLNITSKDDVDKARRLRAHRRLAV